MENISMPASVFVLVSFTPGWFSVSSSHTGCVRRLSAFTSYDGFFFKSRIKDIPINPRSKEQSAHPAQRGWRR